MCENSLGPAFSLHSKTVRELKGQHPLKFCSQVTSQLYLFLLPML